MSDESQRHVDGRGQNDHVRAAAVVIVRGTGGARVVDRHVRIVEADPPAGAAQRDADRSSDEAQTGDERVARVGHQRAIRMMVRSTTCDVVGSKYGRCTVTCGRFGLREISAARYVPAALVTSVCRPSFSMMGWTARASAPRSPVRK